MAIDRQRGKLDILYLAVSEPTAATDPNDAAYTRIGLLQDLGDEFTNETDTTADRDTGTHEDAVTTTQSSGVDITCNVQKSDGGTVREDIGQRSVRDAALAQTEVWWLINPEDDQGSTIAGLEGVHSNGFVESFSYTRNQGDFKQFEASLINRSAPSFFTTT